MDLFKAKTLAKNLMGIHGLSGYWSFEFDNSLRRFGCCHYRSSKITLSKELVKLNEEKQVRDVILHEIAHALMPMGFGHGYAWRQKARSIGCSAMRCYPGNIPRPEKKYKAVCKNCGYETEYHRKRSVACGRCCNRLNKGLFSENYLLIFNQK